MHIATTHIEYSPVCSALYRAFLERRQKLSLDWGTCAFPDLNLVLSWEIIFDQFNAITLNFEPNFI